VPTPDFVLGCPSDCNLGAPTTPGESPATLIEFSVLITCHYEERSIDEFHHRLSGTLLGLGRPFEIIFVNDGSHDGTWAKLKAIFARDPRVAVVMDMFKNYGQQAAITAALAVSRGRSVVLMDSDLQLLPEELPLLIAEFDRGFDLVTGYRTERKDSLFRILPSLAANIIMRLASHSNLRDFGCTFKIYNAALLRAFHYGPHHLFSNVEVISRIDRIVEVPVSHRPRTYGSSGWTIAKLIKYNMDNVVVLSERPFQWTAFLCLLGAVFFLLRLALNYVVPVRILPPVTNGFVLNAIVICFLLNVAILSLVGEFSIRSFFSVRKLPLYVVRETLSRGAMLSDAMGGVDEK
jgi:glycosyltransferase involved in cell wall biosynthesis